MSSDILQQPGVYRAAYGIPVNMSIAEMAAKCTGGNPRVAEFEHPNPKVFGQTASGLAPSRGQVLIQGGAMRGSSNAFPFGVGVRVPGMRNNFTDPWGNSYAFVLQANHVTNEITPGDPTHDDLYPNEAESTDADVDHINGNILNLLGPRKLETGVATNATGTSVSIDRFSPIGELLFTAHPYLGLPDNRAQWTAQCASSDAKGRQSFTVHPDDYDEAMRVAKNLTTGPHIHDLNKFKVGLVRLDGEPWSSTKGVVTHAVEGMHSSQALNTVRPILFHLSYDHGFAAVPSN